MHLQPALLPPLLRESFQGPTAATGRAVEGLCRVCPGRPSACQGEPPARRPRAPPSPQQAVMRAFLDLLVLISCGQIPELL